MATKISKSCFAKHIVKKYKFNILEAYYEQTNNDYIRIIFNNKPCSCEFNSCLGNCLYVNAVGHVGICPFVENDIILNKDITPDTIYDMFNTESFMGLLRRTIEKRKTCKESCPFYEGCKGGCALKGNVSSPINNCHIYKEIREIASIIQSSQIDNEITRKQRIEQLANMYRI